MSAYPENQRRSGTQWETPNRSVEWVGEEINREGPRLDERNRDGRAIVPGGAAVVSVPGRQYEDPRDLGRGDRRGRDLAPDLRPPALEVPHLDRGDVRLDRDDARIERNDARPVRADRSLERSGDIYVDRGLNRDDSRVDRRQSNRQSPPFDQRRFRGIGPNERREGIRDRSPINNRGLEFDRPGNAARGGIFSRPGNRDVRMERDRELPGMLPRDRYLPNDIPLELRNLRDDRPFRDEFPDPNIALDRRLDPTDRYEMMDGRDPRNLRARGLSPPDGKMSRVGLVFDEGRDDRTLGRGLIDDRFARDRGLRRGGMYSFNVGLENRNLPDTVGTLDPDLGQRRGHIMPDDDALRRGARVEGYDLRDTQRGRDDRIRRDQVDLSLERDIDRIILSARSDSHDRARDASRDAIRDQDLARDVAKEIVRDPSREISRDSSSQGGRSSDARRRVSPTEKLDLDKNQERDRDRQDRRSDRSPKRDGLNYSEKGKQDGKMQEIPIGQDSDTVKRPERKESEKRPTDDISRDRAKEKDFDTLSTRSADAARKKNLAELGTKATPLQKVEDRDSRSDGKRYA